jgi:hypothetical protein
LVSNDEIEVLQAHDTRSLVLFLKTLEESNINCCATSGLPLEWLIDDEKRVSIVKSELARRGAFNTEEV